MVPRAQGSWAIFRIPSLIWSKIYFIASMDPNVETNFLHPNKIGVPCLVPVVVDSSGGETNGERVDGSNIVYIVLYLP
eukprot:scaffold17205_cov186-Amphora_coffeaeformis.AAC.17